MKVEAWVILIGGATVYGAGISSVSCNVKDFGASGDGFTYDNEAFAEAFSACNGLNTRVIVPEGNYLLYPFNLTSNLDLYLEENAILMATTDFSMWPKVASLPSYPPESEPRYGPFIGGEGIENVSISGFGSIDGQGKAWWDAADDGTIDSHGRPRLIEPMYCKHFSISGISIFDPPFWAVHPYVCDDLLFENIFFTAPVTSPNTDGIDPDSCSNVVIRNFTASCGDDAIAIKSGKDEYGRSFNISSYNILIEGGIIGPSSGINIGSEMSGGVYNVLVKGVTFKGGLYSARIKSARGRGSYVRNITFEDFLLEDNVMGPSINMFYADGEPLPPGDPGTPHIYDITYRHHSGNALTGGTFLCLPESPCKNILFDGFNVTTRIAGLECLNAYGESIGDVMKPDSCLK